jgi:L-threonylcarbamoyladenylate synthase
MKEVWLYPTETIYALGVNAFDADALKLLAEIKGRPATQAVSCLVRTASDIEEYATVNDNAKKLIARFLPGPLTIILPCTDVRLAHVSTDGSVSFRISPDSVAQQTVAAFMEQYGAPLTCTSANLHGKVPAQKPESILNQLGAQASFITKIIDDGPRSGTASTVVSCISDTVEIIRVGAISPMDILEVTGR